MPEAIKQKCDWLEDLAFRGEPMPGGLSFADSLLFLKFRYLYAYAKLVQMPPEQGRKEKQNILTQYVIDDFNNDLFMQNAERYKACEAAACAIRKDSDLMVNEKVRALLEALYGGVING